jgi:hypothetical protein
MRYTAGDMASAVIGSSIWVDIVVAEVIGDRGGCKMKVAKEVENKVRFLTRQLSVRYIYVERKKSVGVSKLEAL